MYISQIALAVLVTINIAAFVVMANDKRKSANDGNTKRTPEGLIFFIAAIFGAVGVYVGMLVFRHKTKRWYFQLGIPLMIVQNLATLYVLNKLIIVN